MRVAEGGGVDAGDSNSNRGGAGDLRGDGEVARDASRESLGDDKDEEAGLDAVRTVAFIGDALDDSRDAAADGDDA